ncbi:MAG: anion transporter [Deltaproteobacteria bacterium]|nr:anion transporter [Deltaproteobacteria bacterium]
MPTDYLPIIILAGVVVMTAVRRIGGLRLDIWQIMLIGAAADLAAGSISPHRALMAVNPDVMLFLFGMFVVGEALVESGYLYHVSYSIFKAARSTDALVLLILFVMGFFSAVLMNDTVAIIGTPLTLFFAEKHNISSKLMLLTLCFAITIGSVASPIGNPQNLLVAINGGITGPFAVFFKHLAVPTVVNIFAAYLVLKFFFRAHFHKTPLENSREALKDPHLASLSRVSLVLVILLVSVKVVTISLAPAFDFRLTYIALIAASPIIFLSPKRFTILRGIDWRTLVFFASMFVVMDAVWSSGAAQGLLRRPGFDPASMDSIFALSVLLSQVLSNVPFVALYLPVLTRAGAGVDGMMALAAGSTIAGNLLILGAASNVIVIQNAEKRGATLSFIEFARVGVPLTIINVAVYWGYLKVIG